MPQLHVLFVDDDPDEFYLFNEAIEHGGLDVKLTHLQSSNRLFELLEESKPDLVFMDINMPYKDGVEALAEIRNSSGYQTLPIVIYSTTKNKNSIKMCHKKGADLFVIKPNDFNGLAKVVKKVCSIDWPNHQRQPLENFLVSEF